MLWNEATFRILIIKCWLLMDNMFGADSIKARVQILKQF